MQGEFSQWKNFQTLKNISLRIQGDPGLLVQSLRGGRVHHMNSDLYSNQRLEILS